MRPKVSVIVCTYNQEQTIARTLDHILCQKTSYPYEIILGEDASPDGTRSVCEDYAQRYSDIIHLLPKTPNKGLMKNYRDCMAEARGEYIMACAGDDWWHNDRKMEMQVDFLEKHPEYVMTYSGCIRYNVLMGTKTVVKAVVPAEDTFRALLKVDYICAPTACFRSSAFDIRTIDEYISKGYPMEDYPMWLEMCNKGLFKGLDVEMVTYTHNSNSASTFQSLEKQVEFEEWVQRVRIDMVKKYQKENEFNDEYLEDIYYRNLYSHGIKFNDRSFSLQSILKVHCRTRLDYVKIFMASNSLTYSILRNRNKIYATE